MSAPPVRTGTGDAWPTPRLVTSRCLELEACRYNGQVIRSPVVRSLAARVELVPVCPEVGIGLGVPRDPIRLVRLQGRTHLVQPSTGRDLTDAMARFRRRWLAGAGSVDGFLLKSRSPSCGTDGVNVYDDPEGEEPVGRAPGMFAAAVLERFPDTPVEHEARLADPDVRDRFLTDLFALADLRRVREAGTVAALVEFQERHELTLMARSPTALGELRRLVSGDAVGPAAAVPGAYETAFRKALRHAPDRTAHLRVLRQARSRFEGPLPAKEERRFLRLEEEYRQGRVERSVLLALLRSWAGRLGEPTLALQSYLSPYPPDLRDRAREDGGG